MLDLKLWANVALARDDAEGLVEGLALGDAGLTLGDDFGDSMVEVSHWGHCEYTANLPQAPDLETNLNLSSWK